MNDVRVHGCSRSTHKYGQTSEDVCTLPCRCTERPTALLPDSCSCKLSYTQLMPRTDDRSPILLSQLLLLLLLLLLSHELIVTMQYVVTGQAPLTLEGTITSEGKQPKSEGIKHNN